MTEEPFKEDPEIILEDLRATRHLRQSAANSVLPQQDALSRVKDPDDRGDLSWVSAMHSVAVFLDKNYPCRCETAEDCAGNILEAEEIIRIVRAKVDARG